MALDRQHVIDRLAVAEPVHDLSGLDLSGADLSRLDLRRVNLSRADLTSADLRWAVLEEADLDSSVLRRADLRWAVLRGAHLRDADLVRANLGWADLAGADLTGADLDGVNLDSATLDDTVFTTASPGRRAAVRSAPRAGGARRTVAAPGSRAVVGGRPRVLVVAGRPVTLPAVSPAVVAGAVAVAVAAAFLWGWLYRHAYFETGFGLAGVGVVRLADVAPNLRDGLLHVLPVTAGVLLLSPLFLVAVALVAALVAAVPLALAYGSQRVLADVERPELRPLVVVGLFVAMTVFFLLFAPPAIEAARTASSGALPRDSALGSVFTLFAVGGLLTRLGYLAVLGLAAVVLYVLWRALAHRIAEGHLPADLRIRYPALDAAFVNLRQSRVVGDGAPPTAELRRRGRWAAIGLVLLLGTVLAGVGQVDAYHDMCDGGDLPRGQLFVNGVPSDAAQRLLCQRMLARTEDGYFVFFPHETTEKVPGDLSSRVANVHSVAVADEIEFQEATSDSLECPTCVSPAEERDSYTARSVIDPAEVEVRGPIVEQTGQLLTLDVPEGQVGSVRLLTTTTVEKDGRAVAAGELLPGVTVAALGRLATDGPILDARIIDIVESAPPLEPAQLVATLDNPEAIVVSGSGFRPGAQVSIGISPVGTNSPMNPLVLDPVQVSADGSFSVPVRWHPGLPVGPDKQIVARDPASGQFATAPWLAQAPAATPTPRPSPTPLATEEDQDGEPTSTPWDIEPGGPDATNTPLPTRLLPDGSTVPGSSGGVGECQGDTFEPDWPRGFEKEIYVGFGDQGSPQKHTFCGRGARWQNDIDLAYFQVKGARWYRVRTTNLSPGVDTVMAVGDLGPSAECYPAGCWSDDRAALTYESEIIFRAPGDGRAMITVDNRGSAYGAEAGYDLSVSEFVPEPTPTPTLKATGTATPTPSATRTPLPFKDVYEVGNRCRKGEIYGPPAAQGYLYVNVPAYAVIADRNDEDFYETEPLVQGTTYQLVLQPPQRQDYDVELLTLDASETTCTRTPLRSTNYGEGVSDSFSFQPVPGVRYIVRVFSPYPTIFSDAFNPYELLLRTVGGAPNVSATPSPPPTSSPTPTLTPSITPTPPRSEGDILPATATPTRSGP